MHLLDHGYPISRETLDRCCEMGHFELAKIIIEKHRETQTTYILLTKAASSGSIEMVRLLLENSQILEIESCLSTKPLTAAIESGSLEVVKMLHNAGYDMPLSAPFMAISKRHGNTLALIEWLREVAPKTFTIDMVSKMIDLCKHHGSLELFTAIHAFTPPKLLDQLYRSMGLYASSTGDVAVLQKYPESWRIFKHTRVLAISNGQVEVEAYLASIAVELGNIDIQIGLERAYWPPAASKAAAGHNYQIYVDIHQAIRPTESWPKIHINWDTIHADDLAYLYDNKLVEIPTNLLLDIAVESNNVAVISCLLARGQQGSGLAMDKAANLGNLEIICQLLKHRYNECPVTQDTFKSAMAGQNSPTNDKMIFYQSLCWPLPMPMNEVKSNYQS
eukprot:gene8002-9397_t